MSTLKRKRPQNRVTMHPDLFQKYRMHCSPQHSPVSTQCFIWAIAALPLRTSTWRSDSGTPGLYTPARGPDVKTKRVTRPRGCRKLRLGSEAVTLTHFGSRQAPSHGKQHWGPRKSPHGGTPEAHCWKHCANKETVNTGHSGLSAPRPQGLPNTLHDCSLNPHGAHLAGVTVIIVVPSLPKKPR